jgi:hypothetical protein
MERHPIGHPLRVVLAPCLSAIFRIVFHAFGGRQVRSWNASWLRFFQRMLSATAV